MYADKIMDMMNNHKKQKIEQFVEMTRQNFIKDVEGTAKIYTRDKDKFPFKVFKLKSGTFAVMNPTTNEIYYKNDDVHLCKVEFVLMCSMADGTMSMFAERI